MSTHARASRKLRNDPYLRFDRRDALNKELDTMNLFEQDVLICMRCTGDLRSHLGEKIKRVLREFGLSWRNTSTHEGKLTQEQFEDLSRKLNEVINNHNGPGRVMQLIAKVGQKTTWVDILEAPESKIAA